MDIVQPALQRELKSFALSLLKNEEEAQDVVQDVMVQLLEKKSSVVNRSYLFQAVRNQSFNRLRGQKRYQATLNSWADWLSNFVFGEFQEEYGVSDIILDMPLKDREILIMRLKLELSHQEMAEILSIPVGTVKSRINRALSALKKKMKGQYHGTF